MRTLILTLSSSHVRVDSRAKIQPMNSHTGPVNNLVVSEWFYKKGQSRSLSKSLDEKNDHLSQRW
jgi:hypothetical protein